MDIVEVQMVLDRIVTMFGDTLSPQIMRSAVEYAKVMAPIDGETGDDEPVSLAQRAQGFIAGYCDFIDGKVAKGDDEIDVADQIAKDVVSVIREDYGEEYSYLAFAGAARYADLVAAGRPDDIDDNKSQSALRNCIMGYLDGYFQAECDTEDGKFIRDVGMHVPRDYYMEMIDLVSEDVEMNADYKDEIKDSIADGLDKLFQFYLYPRSGHVVDEQVSPEAFMTLYMLGFLKGADSVNDVEAETLPFSQVQKDVSPTERIVMREIVTWAERWSMSKETGERAAAATYAFASNAAKNTADEDAPMTAMDTVFGMGYVDGLHFLLGDKVMKSGKNSMRDLIAEVDAVFAEMED